MLKLRQLYNYLANIVEHLKYSDVFNDPLRARSKSLSAAFEQLRESFERIVGLDGDAPVTEIRQLRAANHKLVGKNGAH